MKPTIASIAFHNLSDIAQGENLELLGVFPRGLDLNKQRDSLRIWQERGFAGDMNFMKREPDLYVTPERILPNIRSLAVFSARYKSARHPKLTKGEGRIARYAWGKDYHDIIRDKLEKIVAKCSELSGKKIEYRCFTDSVPILERAYAAKSGLGFIGKNTLFIRPKLGSFTFLADILWNVDVIDIPTQNTKESCGACTNCLTNCPTGAFTDAYVLDARRCISYLTIEKRGSLEVWEREALGEWVFGCDICQDVCPFNHTSIKQDPLVSIGDFHEASGVGPTVNLGEVLAIRDNTSFKKRFEGTPLTRTRREGLLRNAACVAANTLSEGVSATLVDCLEDPSDVVRQHALWALSVLRENCDSISDKTFRALRDRALKDVSLLVREEAQRLLELGDN